MNLNYTIFVDFFLYVKIMNRVHPINVQLVMMLAKEEHGCDPGSESLDKYKPRDILHCHVERPDQSFAVAERAER
jgi:hypothetical protein